MNSCFIAPSTTKLHKLFQAITILKLFLCPISGARFLNFATTELFVSLRGILEEKLAFEISNFSWQKRH